MNKKIIALLLATITLVSFTACGGNTQQGQSEETARTKYEGSTYEIEKGVVPAINLTGEYYEEKDISNAAIDDGLVTYLYTDDNAQPDYEVYRFGTENYMNEEQSLEDCVAEEASYADTDYTMLKDDSSYWNDENSYTYGYYTNYEYKALDDEEKYYCQNFMFENKDNSEFIEICIYNKGNLQQIGSSNNYISIPSSFEETDISDEQAKEGCVKAFKTNSSDITININEKDAENKSYDDIIKDYEKTYTGNNSEFADYEVSYVNDIELLYTNVVLKENGSEYEEDCYTIINDNKMYEVKFTYSSEKSFDGYEADGIIKSLQEQ